MEEPRIGVYVCWCGTNIAKMVDVEEVAKKVANLPNVVIAKDYKYMCSDPGQELIIKDIQENKLNRIVVSACSPRIHELTFRKALENAGVNQYMFEMANIREHVSWVHENREEATKKAFSLISAAVKRVAYHESLDKRYVEINPATLVIGGGISGLNSALEIAGADKQVYLVEKSDKLGGNVLNIDLTFPYLNSAKQILQPLIDKVNKHPKIKVYLNTKVDEVNGYIGNFNTKLNVNGQKEELMFGHVVLASGLKPYNPEPLNYYGYNKIPDVITSFEFEKMLLEGKIVKKDGTEPKNIAIIHCVGSRNDDVHEYCSRTCCATALKYSNQLRSALPGSNIFSLYEDIRVFSKGSEEFYASTHKKRIMFLKFNKGDLPLIKKAPANDSCSILIEMNEKLSGEQIEVPADMVILMVAMEAHEDAKSTGIAVGVSLCGNEFYIEKHPKLDPVATTTEGVYIVGACQGPKDIPDSIAQARAASARILATIAKQTVQIEVTTAFVNEEKCCGCKTCIKVCPYTAISFNEEKSVSVVNEALCKGCGTCGSTCPTGAIKSKHFTDEQILNQIEGLMEAELTYV